jgi:hypothetical protein
MSKPPTFTFDDPNKRNASKLEAITYVLSDHINPGVNLPEREVIHRLFLIMDDGQTGKDIAAVLGHERPVEMVEVIDPEEERKRKPRQDR